MLHFTQANACAAVEYVYWAIVGHQDIAAIRNLMGDPLSFACARFSGNPDIVRAGANNPMLKQGSRGEAVKILQMALIDLGFAMPASTQAGTSLPDGIFGQETARIVAAFQRANGLTPDGIAGAKTLARLDSLLSVRSETTARADLIRGRKATGRG